MKGVPATEEAPTIPSVKAAPKVATVKQAPKIATTEAAPGVPQGPPTKVAPPKPTVAEPKPAPKITTGEAAPSVTAGPATKVTPPKPMVAEPKPAPKITTGEAAPSVPAGPAIKAPPPKTTVSEEIEVTPKTVSPGKVPTTPHEAVPTIRGQIARGVGMGILSLLVSWLGSKIQAKTDQMMIEMDLKNRWPEIEKDMNSLGAEVAKLRSEAPTQKIYGNVTIELRWETDNDPEHGSLTFYNGLAVKSVRVSRNNINTDLEYARDERAKGWLAMAIFGWDYYTFTFSFEIPSD
jgi:hypothetical protein